MFDYCPERQGAVVGVQPEIVNVVSTSNDNVDT